MRTYTIPDASDANLAMGAFIQIDKEILLITSVSGNTLSVLRGQASSSASSHAAGAHVAACLAPGRIYQFGVELMNPEIGQEPGQVCCCYICVCIYGYIYVLTPIVLCQNFAFLIFGHA